MNNLEKAKEIVKEHYSVANCGIFNSRNIVGDTMVTIYEDEGLTVDVCYSWAYFEVFGLSDAEFEELETYYDLLKKEVRNKEGMNEMITWNELECDSVNGYGIQIHYSFNSFDKSEIDRVKKWCESHIHAGVKFENQTFREESEV